MASRSAERSTYNPPSTPLSERFTEEFLDHSLSLLAFSTQQDAPILDASALRFEHPEPPRFPDLPVLPPKRYPRISAELNAAVLEGLTPPAADPRFVGRKIELDQAVSALLLNKQVVITGESGTGRTALLRQIANDPRIRKQFRRVWWLDHAQRVQLTLAVALNATNILMAAEAEQPTLIREQLEPQGTLLLVDDVGEHADLLLRITNRIAIVADTSPSVATRIKLGGFTPDTGAEILSRNADKPPKDVKTLGALVDHHPRTITVLAGLIHEDGLSPDSLIGVLQGLSSPDQLKTLTAESLAALPSDYLNLCRQLAINSGVWINLNVILEQFGNSLAGQRAVRFLTQRGFLEHRKDNAGETIRTAGTWAELLRKAPPTDLQPFVPITRPIDDYDPAQSGDREDIVSADQQITAVQFIDQNKDEDAERLLLEALVSRQGRGEKYATAETLTALARLAYWRGEDGNAIRRLENAAELLNQLRDEAALTIVRVALSRAYRRAGRLDAALNVLGDEPIELAMVYRMRGEWNDAITIYQRHLKSPEVDDSVVRRSLAETFLSAGKYSEVIKTLEGDTSLEANWLRGQTLHAQGNTAEAIQLYEQILTDAQPELRAPIARAASRIFAQQGDLQAAILMVQAQGVWYESRMQRQAFARGRMSYALAAQYHFMAGNIDQAESSAFMASTLSPERQDPLAEALVARILGRVCLTRHQLDAALKHFEAELNARSSLRTLTGYIDEHELGVTLHSIADIQAERGETDRAIANYRRALKSKDPNRDRRSTMLTLFALRTVLDRAKRFPDMLEAGQQAVDLLTKRDDAELSYVGYALCAQSQAQFTHGRPERGRAALNEWMERLSKRIDEGISDSHPGVRVLATSLHLNTIAAQNAPIHMIDLAEQALDLIEREAPNSGAAWSARRDLANSYLRLGRWNEAHEVFTPLLKVSSQTAPFLSLATRLGMARAAMQLGNVPEATDHFTSAVELEPEITAQGMIWREVAEMYHSAGDESTAAEYYVRAIEVLRQGKNSAAYIDSVVKLAYTRLRLRRFNDAIDTLQEAYQIADRQPENATQLKSDVLYEMATAHATLGQFKRAAERYRESLDLQNMRTDADRYLTTLIALARSSVAADQLAPALIAYHDALGFGTLVPELRRSLLIEQAEAFAQTAQPAEAIKSYDAARKLAGTSAVEMAIIERGLGSAYTALGEYERAREHFEVVLSVAQDEQTGQTLAALGDGYRAQGNIGEAIQTYLKALQSMDRADVPVEVAGIEGALGELYLEQNQLFEALKHLVTGLEIERSMPQQNGAHVVKLLQHLAEVHERRGEIEQATRRHHEALVYQDVRHAPDAYISTLIKLGRLYLQLGKHGEAIKAYEEALNTEGKQATQDRGRIEMVKVAMGEVYRDWGKLEDSAGYFRQVAKSMNNTPTREKARDLLRQTEAEIARHLQTLEVAEQSLAVLGRASKPDLAEAVFVYALQAQTAYMLGRWDISIEHQNQIVDLLSKRRADLQKGDKRPVFQALTAWLQGHIREQEATTSSDSTSAGEYFQHAFEIMQNDLKRNSALMWVITQKATANYGSTRRGGRGS